jgi:hypothetical protein
MVDRVYDSIDRSLDLNLWSSCGNRIMDYCTLTETGGKNSVAASGSMDAQKITLMSSRHHPTTPKERIKSTISTCLWKTARRRVQKSGELFLGKGNATAVKQ